MAEIVYRAERVSVSASQLAAWHVAAPGSTLRLTGPCPACRHSVTAVVSPTGTALENLSASATSATASELTVAISCNCGHEHKGRSREPIGCGRTWTALAATDGNGAVALHVADDPYLSDAAEAWRASQANQLERLRAAAERWIAGVSALLGLLTVLGFGLGASEIRMLTFGGRLAVAVVAAVVLGSGGIAVLRLAAHPNRRERHGTADLVRAPRRPSSTDGDSPAHGRDLGKRRARGAHGRGRPHLVSSGIDADRPSGQGDAARPINALRHPARLRDGRHALPAPRERRRGAGGGGQPDAAVDPGASMLNTFAVGTARLYDGACHGSRFGSPAW